MATPRQILAAIPKASFLFGPSPLQPLRRLSAHLGGAEVWAKREDLNSGLAYGGNKVRKLEYLVADAKAQGCDTLVSIGGVQSNHTRAVTAVAVHSGLKAVTVQEHWVDWEDPGYEKVGNIQLSRLMGGDVRLVDAGFSIGHRESLDEAMRNVEARSGKPYFIPAGASDHPLGGMGFVSFMLELAQQESQLGVFFDTVIVCAVTGSSFAGCLVGARLLEQEGGRKRQVLGIDASGKPQATEAQVDRIAQSTNSLLGLPALPDGYISLDDRFHAGVYGIPDASTTEAMKLGASTEAMITDPVYEGKTLAGLIELVKSGQVAKDSKVLFVHLGGQPALNAYSTIP